MSHHYNNTCIFVGDTAHEQVYAIKDLQRIRASVFDEVKKLSYARERRLNELQNATAELEELHAQVRRTGELVECVNTDE